MRLSGYQPQYFPRLHYFARALDSDVFEISDYLQFVRKHAYHAPDGTLKRGKSFQAHTPIKLVQGEFLLSIPTHEDLLSMNKTPIDYGQNWVYKHLKSIETGYAKSPNFKKFFPEIEKLLEKKYKGLAGLTTKSIFWGFLRLLTDDKIEVDKLSVGLVNEQLGKRSPFRLKNIFVASGSPIPAPKKGEANKWIVALCKYAGADEYYHGGTSHAAYMDIREFEKAGIKTALQDWHCPTYRQQYTKVGFLPNLSVIDLVMNEDLKGRQSVIKGESS